MKILGKKLILACCLALVVFPGSASALSPEQQRLFNLGVNYFDFSASACSTVSSESGTGPLFGLSFPDVADPNDLVTRINTFIDTFPASPFKGLGNEFVAAGQKYNINPAMVVGIATKEEGLGTVHNTAVDTDHNSFGASNGTIDSTPDGSDGFEQFPSFEASIDPINKYLSDTYVHADPASPHYATSVLELMKNGYTPGTYIEPGVGIPHYAYAAKQTLSTMHKILDGIAETGQPTTTTTSFDPGTVSDTQCTNTNGYQSGANGYDLSAMAHFYQCDPAWGNKMYGTAGTICVQGCGITSLTDVIDTLKGLNETPDFFATKYGQYNVGGTSWALWPVAAKDYGLQESDIGSDFAKAAAVLRQGGLIIIPVDSSGGSYFTSDSHLMVLRAVDNQGNFWLANTSKYHEDQAYSADFLKTHGFMGSLFAFTK